MLEPHGLEIIENCFTCKTRGNHIFCDLSPATLRDFEKILFPTVYPKGSVLFVEGQQARGIFILCKGRIKLSFASADGKVLIRKIAEAGEVHGLGECITDEPYHETAETVDPSQVGFVKRRDLLRFLKKHPEASLRASELLSHENNLVFRECHAFLSSRSVGEKLARLLLNWSGGHPEGGKQERHLRMSITHEEIAEMIGSSRETVCRLMTEMKGRGTVQFVGATLIIRDIGALEAMAGERAS